MKKESVYLPNLNSLFMQDVHYRMHRHKLRNCKSSIDSYSSHLIINTQTTDLPPQQVLLLEKDKSQSSIRKIKSKVLLRYHSTDPSQKERKNLSPLQKRKISDRDGQNSRINQILHASKCSGYGPSKSNIQNYEVLRQRISKYVREGINVKYKFKKSLQEIQKRKQSIKQNRSESVRQNVVQQARKIISNSNNKKMVKNEKNHFSDIYLHTMRSNLKDGSTNRQSQRTSIQKSQTMSIIQQNNIYSNLKKQLEIQRIHTEPSFISGLPNSNKTQHKKYTLDFISQIKLRKKEKFVQKAILPSTALLRLQKSNLNDLQVVQVQPLPKPNKTNLYPN